MNRNQLIALTVVYLSMGWLFATGVGKTQWVRIFDIFLYGPYLIYLSFQDETYKISDREKMFLIGLGATTITYNLRNYLRA